MTVEMQLQCTEMEYNRISIMLSDLQSGAASIQLKSMYDTIVITDIFPHYKQKLIDDLRIYSEELNKQVKRLKEAKSC